MYKLSYIKSSKIKNKYFVECHLQMTSNFSLSEKLESQVRNDIYFNQSIVNFNFKYCYVYLMAKALK